MTAALRLPKTAAVARDFQGALDQLIAEPAPRLVRLWPFLGVALVASLVGAAALLPVDVVITAPGKLAADAPPVLLRPLNRAVLRDLLVRPGDVVEAGQILARLDATLPLADRAALQAERRSIAAEIARREAELSGAPLPAQPGPEAAGQADLLAARADLALARQAALSATIAALQRERQIEVEVGTGLAERLAIARELLTMREALLSRQSGSQLEALQARAARIDAETALRSHRARLAEIDRRIRAAQDEGALLAHDLHREAAEALPPLRLRLSQIEDALEKAGRLADLTELVAPRPGVVLSVAAGGAGAVVAEGEPVVALVPSDAGLVAEISLSSADMGRVAPGDAVTLKFDAFPWRRSGAGEGRLESLAPATYTPEGGTSALNPARVSVLSAPAGLAAGTRLLPGMTLTAEVQTGTRTVLDYFLDPLLRGMSESLREP